MAHPNKVRGDKFEREAVEVLVALAPGLCVENPMRMLGAGRKDDIGDLRVYRDVTMQVKAYNDPAKALRLAASGALEQSDRALTRWAVGLVPILGARKGTVRWMAVAVESGWPAPKAPLSGLPAEIFLRESLQPVATVDPLATSTFGYPSDAIAWVRREPDAHRIARIVRSGHDVLLVSSLATWVTDLSRATEPVSSDG